MVHPLLGQEGNQHNEGFDEKTEEFYLKTEGF